MDEINQSWMQMSIEYTPWTMRTLLLLLTPLYKMADIFADGIFKCIFVNENI